MRPSPTSASTGGRCSSTTGANADEWTLTGTHLGEYFGIAPTGRRIEVDGATFSRFGADGLVVHDTNYIDVAGLLNQLAGD